jgi:hypothetical protein
MPDSLAAVSERGKVVWRGERDSLVLGAETLTDRLPIAPDLIELDAMRRRESVVVIDPQTGKLHKAYWRLPANRPGPANRLESMLYALKRGVALPDGTPIEYDLDYYPKGYALRYEEAAQYPVLMMQAISLRSMEDLARYVVGGGFVVQSGDLTALARAIRARANVEVKQIEIGLEHPLFRASYEIDAYSQKHLPPKSTCRCPFIEPLNGLEINGRHIAVALARYMTCGPCRYNQLYVNALTFGLTQPSPMGGRYMRRVIRQ